MDSALDTMKGHLARRDVARELLSVTDVRALRKEVRFNRRWRSVFHGFRPDSLTRSLFVTGATSFALDTPLLVRLIEVFLDSINTPQAKTLTERLATAANEATNPDTIRQLCKTLSEVDVVSLPVVAPAGLISPSEAANETIQVVALSEPVPLIYGDEAHSSDATSDGNVPERDIKPATVSRSTADTEGPIYLRERVKLDWESPSDHVTEIQQAVTLFERSLVALVRRQLEGLYGDAWLRRGCGPWRELWKTKAGLNTAVQPATLLGYAELAEIHDVIVRRENWRVFAPYFQDKESVDRAFGAILPLRVSGMHPGERKLYVVEQVAALQAMIQLARSYHTETADQIDRLFQGTFQAAPDLPAADVVADEVLAGERIQTNLGDFSDPQLVGRDRELRELQNFWEDEHARTVSIIGQGGVGKTTLLDSFTHSLLAKPAPAHGPPEPEVIVYLTAKDNYLPNMRRAPESKRFRSVRRIYEGTLETLDANADLDVDLKDLRNSVLSLARAVPILFALDNLESLSDDDYEAVGTFLDELPWPSKAIVTTRLNRRVGRKVQLDGLTRDDARELMLRRLAAIDIIPSDSDLGLIDEHGRAAAAAGGPVADPRSVSSALGRRIWKRRLSAE